VKVGEWIRSIEDLETTGMQGIKKTIFVRMKEVKSMGTPQIKKKKKNMAYRSCVSIPGEK
jgi:hypothetical protein